MPNYSLPSGPDEPPPPAGASNEAVLAWAERTGRITAASRSRWAGNLTIDPDNTNAVLRILARAAADGASTAPPATARPRLAAAAAPPASYGSTRMQTASGLDVSSLPKQDDEADAARAAQVRLMADAAKAQTAWRESPQNPAVQADIEAKRRRENEKLAAAEAIDRQSRWNRT